MAECKLCPRNLEHLCFLLKQVFLLISENIIIIDYMYFDPLNVVLCVKWNVSSVLVISTSSPRLLRRFPKS